MIDTENKYDKQIALFHDELPPSSNAIYQRLRNGGVTLSTPARIFVKGLTAFLQQHLYRFNELPRGNDVVYEIVTILYMPCLNTTYLTGKAKSPYKVLDIDNRVKLIFDTLKKFVADDCMFFTHNNSKFHTLKQEDQGVQIIVSTRDPSDFGVSDEYQH